MWLSVQLGTELQLVLSMIVLQLSDKLHDSSFNKRFSLSFLSAHTLREDVQQGVLQFNDC